MANNLHMNGRQLEVEKAKLKDERQVLKELKETYNKASKDIANNIRIQQGRINVLLKNIDKLSDEEKSILQAATYQKQFQERLKKQIDGYIDTLNSAQHGTMDKYLKQCYDTGFIGSIYDMHGQGVPIIAPINQKQVARATALTPKLSRKMYGTYAGDVKQAVRREISRGIATADSFAHIARNVNAATNMGFNKMMRIVRTEGHRIQSMSAFDAQHAAKDAGADIVKQWNAALDGKTRDTHRQLDGQIRELDEPFEVGGMTAMYPSDFGDPAEDINCRCALQQRAKWALDEDELQTLKDRAAYFGLDKSKSFADFEKKYLRAADETSAATKDMSALVESISNKHGININVDLVKNMPDTVSRNLRALDELLDNYNHTVVDYQFAKSTNAEGGSALMINGKTAIKISPKNIKTAGVTDTLNLGKNLDVSITYHEFAHALSQSREKIDPEFWKEIKKIRTQYRKELKDIEKAEIVDHTMTAAEAQIAKKKIFISNYADTEIDEFLAEAFTQAKLAKNPSLYSQKVLEVVDKYFAKKATASAKLNDILSANDRDKIKDITIRKTIKIKQGFSAFPEGDVLIEFTKNIEPDGNKFDVAMHGSPDAVGFGSRAANMSPRLLANIIRHHEDYHGQEIRLLACNTGVRVGEEYCFAEELANALGVVVYAPNDLLFIRKDGTFYIGIMEQGDLIPYKPNEMGRFK